jgi:hypothetical protein
MKHIKPAQNKNAPSMKHVLIDCQNEVKEKGLVKED